MKKLSELMSIYESYHAKPITKFTHFIGIPAILFAFLILFSYLHLPANLNFISLAWIFSMALLVYYFLLDVTLALITAIFLIPMTLLAQWIVTAFPLSHSLIILIAIFLLGAIMQLIGHLFEGNRPAFMGNFFQVFIAPIFIVAELVFSLGFKKELHREVLRKSAR